MVTLKLVTAKTEANDEVIEKLREVLRRAEAGEFAGLCLVAARPDGTCMTTWTRCLDMHALISGTAVLQHRMIKSHIGE